MKRRAALLATSAAIAIATGCGGSLSSEAEATVRAWAEALTTGDNEGAAALFTERPIIVQGALPSRPTRTGLVRWHERLECGGWIVAMRVEGDQVTATFELVDRANRRCPAPGFLSTVTFNMQGGFIHVWTQLPPGLAGP